MHFLFFLIPAAVIAGSAFYLLHALKKRQPIALVGLFCLAMGVFLLALDLALIASTQGYEHIPAYLQFNRPAADTGFAGRWILTVYVFMAGAVFICIYLLARNLITKLNNNSAKDINK